MIGIRVFAVLGALLPLFFLFDRIAPRFYRFDPHRMQTLAKSAIAVHADNPELLMRRLVEELRVEYKGLVMEWNPDNWVFNAAGGALVSQGD